MPTTTDILPRTWISAGHSKLWGDGSTYTEIAYERLPQLTGIETPLDWIARLPLRDHCCSLDTEENKLDSLAKIQSELQNLGFKLPDDFLEFIQTKELQDLVPTCTACYLELSESVLPLPGHPGHYVVRFMNDSQCCFLWYLLFQKDHPTQVLASARFIERDIFDAMQYEEEMDQPLSYDQVLNDARLCAPSFGEFICRFALENTLWHALRDKEPLSPIEETYLQAAK